MQKNKNAVTRVQRSIARAIAVRWFVTLATVWLFLWGILVLIMRMVLGIETPTMLSGVAGIPLALMIAYIPARRRTPNADQIRAKLDALNLDGGILMASAETDLPEWSDEIILSKMPSARWHDSRATAAFITSCIFAATCFLIPQPQSPLLHNKTLAINELIDELQAQVELIKEEDIIVEERADILEENLERIAAEATEDDPMKTWEALDHVADSIEALSAKATEELMNLVEDATTMEALAEALSEALSEQGISDDLAMAMQELSAMLKAKELINKLDGMLPPELAEALSKQMLTPEQLKQLSECLRQCKEGALDKICKMCNASLVDADTLKQCQNIADDCEAALLAFMDENDSDAECLVCLAAMCTKPGNGGISRGRGDAPLTWTDGSDESGAGFIEQTLQPSALGGLDKSRLAGVSRGAPEENKETVEISGGALAETTARGGGAHKQRVLPQHKQAVMRYFHREEK